jgi:hypothetical protein
MVSLWKLWNSPLALHVLLLTCMAMHAIGQELSNRSGHLEESLLQNYADNGYALREAIPIEKLPPRILFPKGEISLVPDPMDRTGQARFGHAKPYMVVYLINDTDEPIPRIIGELPKVRSQVKFGGNWFSREPMHPGCGSVPPPEDLPPRTALALGGISDQWGDISGEIRYVFHIPNRRITSKPQRGRYYAKELQETVHEMRISHLDIDTILGGSTVKHVQNRFMPARNLEEFCAVLELARHHQLSLRERAAIMNWMLERAKKQDATHEQRKAIVRIKGTLNQPWLIDDDSQTLVDRCIAALESKPSSIYGTPEKCRASVWRYLVKSSLSGGPQMAGHESKPADKNSISRLVELAKASLGNSDPDIADAAAWFLVDGWATEEAFATEELLRFLQCDRDVRIRAGLFGLNARGRIREAMPWLMDRIHGNDPNVADYYHIVTRGLRGEMEDWERTMLIYLFEREPLETLTTISVFGAPYRQERLPRECMGRLRTFLNEQISHERKQWWAELTEKDKRGLLAPQDKVSCQALSEGIRILDGTDDPADVPLLQSFLEHPSANSNVYSDGSMTVHFSVRAMAKACLNRRNIKVPDSVVTQIVMQPPLPPRDLSADFKRYILRHDLTIMILSLGVFAGACIGLLRIKLRRNVRT